MKAIVTGAARGIGRAIARRLAKDSETREGAPAQLLIADKHGGELEAVAEELRKSGAQVLAVAADLAGIEIQADMVDRATQAFGGLDVVAANAGFGIGSTLSEMSIEDWDLNFNVHVRGPWLLARAALPWLKQSRGTVVFTGSISGVHATPAIGAYSPSKAAVLMLMRQLAVEWGVHGIRVNAVSPGLTHTSGTDVVYSDQAIKDQRATQIPLRRVADPEDMANVVSFLVGPDAAYVNGADILVDGGLANTLMPNLGMAGPWKGKVTGAA